VAKSWGEQVGDGSSLVPVGGAGAASAYRQFNDPVVGGFSTDAHNDGSDGADAGSAARGAGPWDLRRSGMRTRYIETWSATVSRRGSPSWSSSVRAGHEGLPDASLAATTVFDVDRPGTQRYKLKKLRRTPPRARDVRFVPTDFQPPLTR